jgi:tetrapyrrole methylase family protein/MazG family protein
LDKFDELVRIVKKLRSPDGCEWDKALSLSDMKPYLLEECYELYDSILNYDHEELKEELGDLLFHIVLISQMEKEEGNFNIDDTLDVINDKMIRRHPHVFGNIKTKDVNKIIENWEEIKKQEKKHRESYLDGVPRTLPSLMRAYKIQKKASQVGFDWNNEKDVFNKIKEEINELETEFNKYEKNKDSINNKDLLSNIESEIGDLLFSIVNFSRKMNIDPEASLTRTIDKFKDRFNYIEKSLQKRNKTLKNSSLDDMDLLWEESKKKGF